MPEEEVRSYVGMALTPTRGMTISDPDELTFELERVREEGFATSFEEYVQRVNAIAVPIGKSDRPIVAALAAAGYSYAFTRERAMKALEIVRGIATDVSHKVASSAPQEFEWFDDRV